MTKNNKPTNGMAVEIWASPTDYVYEDFDHSDVGYTHYTRTDTLTPTSEEMQRAIDDLTDNIRRTEYHNTGKITQYVCSLSEDSYKTIIKALSAPDGLDEVQEILGRLADIINFGKQDDLLDEALTKLKEMKGE